MTDARMPPLWLALALLLPLLIVSRLAAEDAPSLERLCADLGSDDPARREAATAALIERGPSARPAVLKRWQETQDPEVRARALAVLQDIDGREVIRALTSWDGPTPAKPDGGKESGKDSGVPSNGPAPDVPLLLQQANGADDQVAAKALLDLNEAAHGVVFDAKIPRGLGEAPRPFVRLLVLLGRHRLARGLEGWGRLLGGGGSPFPATLRPLGPDDVRAIISRDPGEATMERNSDRPQRKTRADGGVYSYRYLDHAPFSPTERVSPVGVVHQFKYDDGGQLVVWHISNIGGPGWIDVLFAHGEPAAIAASDGFAVTFR